MKKNFFFFNLTIIIFSIIHTQLFADSTRVIYNINMPFPSNHLFEVEIFVKESSVPPDGYTEFILSSWRSGRYAVLNLASGVQDFSAEDNNGNSSKWNKKDKNTWRVQNNGSADLKIKYKVFANEFSLRTRGLNDEKAFIDASAVFMYPEKLRYNAVEVNVNPYKDWHVTTGLENNGGKSNSFVAPSYDILADTPMLIGTQKDVEFYEDGKKYTVSFSGEGNYNTDTIVNDFKTFVKTVTDFWKDVPYDHYTFMIVMSTTDFAATEHLNSTIMNIPPLLFSNKDLYRTFLSTAAHEFFHTWNVKQLRPKGLAPYDFTKENYSGELWIAEGITSYYQNLILVRSGLMTAEKYIEILSDKIKADKERPGNYVQSLAESGFDAWIKYNGNAPNKYISESDFYSKGANVGLLLDLEIRHSSENKFSLDDVMRKMYKDFPLDKGGYTNDNFIKVSGEFAGKDLSQFFNAHLYGTDSLDWKKYLSYAGIEVTITKDKQAPSAGIGTRESGDRLYVSYVVPDLPAYKAGLDINDEIIAMNGYKVRRSNFDNRISEMNEGDVIKLTVMREEKLREFEVVLESFAPSKYSVEVLKEPDELQRNIYEAMFKVFP